MFCSLSSGFYFIGYEIADDLFIDEITPSQKLNGRLMFAQDVKINHVREKRKPLCKLSFILFK